MPRSPSELARLWLHAWNTGQLDLLPLTVDFVHTSPFGRFEGADEYLRMVEPMSRASVRAITVRDVVEGPGRAVIAYDVETPRGRVEACDWIFVDGDRIREVKAYYDPTKNREALEEG